MVTSPVPVQKSNPVPPAARVRAPDPFESLRSEMERVFNRFTSGFGWPDFRAGISPGAVVPAADVTEDEESFNITVELPGISEKDIGVTLSDDLLTIKGEKKQVSERKEEGYYLSERSYGMFERSFAVPASVDISKIVASFTNSVLSVVLPKTPQAAPKKIEVKAAA